MERRQDKTEFLAYLVSAWGGFLRVKTADTKRGGHLGAGNNGVEGNVLLKNKKMNYFFSYKSQGLESSDLKYFFHSHLPCKYLFLLNSK